MQKFLEQLGEIFPEKDGFIIAPHNGKQKADPNRVEDGISYSIFDIYMDIKVTHPSTKVSVPPVFLRVYFPPAGTESNLVGMAMFRFETSDIEASGFKAEKLIANSVNMRLIADYIISKERNAWATDMKFSWKKNIPKKDNEFLTAVANQFPIFAKDKGERLAHHIIWNEAHKELVQNMQSIGYIRNPENSDGFKSPEGITIYKYVDVYKIAMPINTPTSGNWGESLNKAIGFFNIYIGKVEGIS